MAMTIHLTNYEIASIAVSLLIFVYMMYILFRGVCTSMRATKKTITVVSFVDADNECIVVIV